jgi:rusticyanin
MMTRKQAMILAGAAVIAAAGVGTGAAIAATSSPSGPTTAASAGPAAHSSSGYPWYRSMMSGRYGGSMMGGTPMMGGSSYGWMMSEAGYRWMTGGTGSPGWMAGGSLPGMMMGGGSDPGKVMGSLWANSPGPRVSAAQAAALGRQVPAGAQVDKAAGTLTLSTATVRLTIVASPAGGPDETFRAAGLTNPRIIVPAGARVTIQLVNADPDTAHGLVVTAEGAAGSSMPMMTARPAFAGSALWFLGNLTQAGMHAGTLTFTTTAPGSYQYLCPVPGHAQKGMAGAFTVR